MKVRFSDFRFFPVLRPTSKGDLILEGTKAKVYRLGFNGLKREYLIESSTGQQIVTA